MDKPQELQFELICRTCSKNLEKRNNYKKYDIFTIPDLIKWLSMCTSLVIEENDGLPKKLCDKCFKKIKEFYEFRTMCIESAKKFHHMISIEQNSNDKEDADEEKILELEIDLNNDENNIEISKQNPDFHLQDQQLININCSNIVQEFIVDSIVQIPNEEDDEEKVFEAQLDALCEEDDNIDNQQHQGDEEEEEEKKLKTDMEIVENLNQNNNKRELEVLEGDNDDEHYDEEIIFEYENKEEGEEEKEVDNDDDEDYEEMRKRRTRKSARKKRIKKENNTNNDDGGVGGHDEKKSNQEIFICEICNKRYFKKEKFEACMRSHKGLKPWVCSECKKEYRKKSSLINHIKYEHKKNCEMYECPVEGCDKRYRLKQTMQVHYRRIHARDSIRKDPKLMKSYICEQCGKSVKTLNALNQHRFTHTGDFPYKCEQCPKRCGTRYQLEVHLKRHKGIKNYICPICGLKKITQQELNTHMNYHSRDKTFTCKFCPYTSCNNGNVVRHERIVHHGIKTFECKYCGKTFGKAETLKHHVMTHTGEKPHQCKLCDRRFIQSTALKTHLKRHDKSAVKTSSSPSTTTAKRKLNPSVPEIKSEVKNVELKIESDLETINATPLNDGSVDEMKLLENTNRSIVVIQAINNEVIRTKIE